MVDDSWEDVVELPDELDDETADDLYGQGTEVQDVTGEVCPSSTENVPKSVENRADANVWKRGDGRYRIDLRKR